jgi:hypothetical protein
MRCCISGERGGLLAGCASAAPARANMQPMMSCALRPNSRRESAWAELGPRLDPRFDMVHLTR